jgi:hypothetical protein
MPRKRPSAHSDQQFAVFLDKIKNTLHADEGAKFEARRARGPRTSTT